ncbi:hypothetical protein Cni_G17014 [Canna indica]|uniref:Uncharacterized protein n=1 Tax=Canna indica TaxID=4628 RepID=A0AAQ3KGH3_9LILI|nr:hypothetical protein Cni_G17014 [Canna indica]
MLRFNFKHREVNSSNRLGKKKSNTMEETKSNTMEEKRSNKLSIGVVVLKTASIFPSKPAPVRQSLPLSHLDSDLIFDIPFSTLRLYASSPSTADPADVIAMALPAALDFYHPLAASLQRCPSGIRLEVGPTPVGVFFIRAASPLTLAEVWAQRDSPLLRGLVPSVLPDHRALVHPVALQVTTLACGGFALGMYVQHALCDGAGATQFLSTVAGFARGAGPPTVVPIWERADLLGPRTPAKVEVPFRDVLGFDSEVASSGPYAVANARTDGPFIREFFDVNEARLNGFRNKLAEEAAMSFTTFQALSAFIWRARIEASEYSNDEVVKLVYSMNIGKLLKPALPAGYWGNVCVPVYVQLTVGELLKQPLWKTAKLIKMSKDNVTDEYVRSYIDFQELHYADGITAGTRVSAFTDWRHLGHSNIDFGWGGPVNVMPLSWKLLGSLEPCFFLPNGTNEVEKQNNFRMLISLPEKDMKRFKACVEKGLAVAYSPLCMETKALTIADSAL